MNEICFSLQSGQFSEDMIPTVGFNMRKVTKGNVTIKVSLKAFFEFESCHFKGKKMEMEMFNIYIAHLSI